MNIQNIVNQYLKRKTNNVILDIIADKENIIETNKNDKTYNILKFIFKNNLFTNKKVINDTLKFAVFDKNYLLVKVLLKYGKADSNQIISKVSIPTLIDEACDMYYCRIAKLLFKYGARGTIWCKNKKDCDEFLNKYCYDYYENYTDENLLKKNNNSNNKNKSNFKNFNNNFQLNYDNIIII